MTRIFTAMAVATMMAFTLNATEAKPEAEAKADNGAAVVKEAKAGCGEAKASDCKDAKAAGCKDAKAGCGEAKASDCKDAKPKASKGCCGGTAAAAK